MHTDEAESMSTPTPEATAEYLRAVATSVDSEDSITGILNVGNVGVIVDENDRFIVVFHPNLWFRMPRETASRVTAILQALLMKPTVVTQ